MDGLLVHRIDYQFLSNSFVCDYSEPCPCYLPAKFSLQPDLPHFLEYDPAKCPQQPFLSSAVPLPSSDLQVDQVSPYSKDTTRYSDTFLIILDEFSIYVDSDSQDLEHEHLNIQENTAKQESEPIGHDAANQTTESLIDVSLTPIENESVEPIANDVPKPIYNNDNISVEPEQQKEECVPPKEVCNTDWHPTEETELPSLEDRCCGKCSCTNSKRDSET